MVKPLPFKSRDPAAWSEIGPGENVNGNPGTVPIHLRTNREAEAVSLEKEARIIPNLFGIWYKIAKTRLRRVILYILLGQCDLEKADA